MFFNGVLNLDAAHGITNATNTGIFWAPMDGSKPFGPGLGPLPMVMTGPGPMLGTGEAFTKFSAPVAGDSGFAFIGTLAKSGSSTPPVTAANDTGIWAVTGMGRNGLIAREGSAAPDANGNPTVFAYKMFVALAMPDDAVSSGPVFLAKVTNGTVTKTCLYGCPDGGSTVELVAVGDTATDNYSGTKTIKSFEVLKAVSGLFSTKPFVQNGGGYLILHVTYTDKTQAIVTVRYNALQPS
jgi:hypothetical protein